MSQQPTSGGLLDLFGTGQRTTPGGGVEGYLDGLLNSPFFNAGVATLANNGDLSAGLRQGLASAQQSQRNRQLASQNDREDQRFQWERDQQEQAAAQRAQWQGLLGLGATQQPQGPGGAPQAPQGQGGVAPQADPISNFIQGLSPQDRQILGAMPDAVAQRFIMERISQPQFETVQNPYGRGGVGQRNSQTGQIGGYQGPVQQTPETFGDPVGVVGPDGKPAFVRYGSRGGERVVNGGFTPATDKGDVFKREDKLRDDFNGITKDYRSIEDAYSRIIASGSNPSAAGDMALIFNYMKLLDPGSVVRESEFRLAGDAGSLPERVQGAFNRVKTGQRLASEQRADFLDRSDLLYQAQYESYTGYADQYSAIAERNGLNPENVIIRLPQIESARPTPSPTQHDRPRLVRPQWPGYSIQRIE